MGTPRRYLNGHCGRKAPYPYVVDPVTGCWVWQWAIDKNGYGLGTFDGKLRRAHRAYYEAAKGSIPHGFHIDHLCHLEAVTPTENTRRSTLTQLNATRVAAIRRCCASGVTQKQVGKLFGISQAQVSRIASKANWADV